MTTKNKILYFEGAGWDKTEEGLATGVGNCRIRTAFHLDNGQPVYLEISGSKRRKKSSPWERQNLFMWKYTGFITACFEITDEDKNDDENRHSMILKYPGPIEYSPRGILEYVNRLGARFDEIKVLPDLAGYRVFKKKFSKFGTQRYNYGDEFVYNEDVTARREQIDAAIYALEKKEIQEDWQRGAGKFAHSSVGSTTYPCYSLWVDEDDRGMLHLLRHFNGFNKHWTIRTDVGETLQDWLGTMAECPLGMYGC